MDHAVCLQTRAIRCTSPRLDQLRHRSQSLTGSVERRPHLKDLEESTSTHFGQGEGWERRTEGTHVDVVEVGAGLLHALAHGDLTLTNPDAGVVVLLVGACPRVPCQSCVASGKPNEGAHRRASPGCRPGWPGSPSSCRSSHGIRSCTPIEPVQGCESERGLRSVHGEAHVGVNLKEIISLRSLSHSKSLLTFILTQPLATAVVISSLVDPDPPWNTR